MTMPDLPPPPRRRNNRKPSAPAALPPPPPEAIEPPPELVVPPAEAGPVDLSPMQVDDLREMVAEKARRMREALRIFEPTPEQERFFACEADERLAIGGNRGGKSTAVLVEIARAAQGLDPYGKYPGQDGIFILVGKDLGQCARVFYRKLFMAGSFDMIRDAATGRWRPYRPNEPADQARQDEVKPAPPLIPPRTIRSISWESKKERIPKTVILKNGWELWFFSSGGEWPQGVAVDGVAFDEEIDRDGWYGEMVPRLVDRRRRDRTGKVRGGKFLWSATPQAGTIRLYALYTRAMEEAADRREAIEAGDEPTPATIEVFQFGMRSNPFLAEEAKASMERKFADDEQEFAVRVEGKFALMGMKVYPEFFPKGIHGVRPFPVPADWTRYAAIDPGRQVCAVLFAAVPPPSHAWAGRAVVYDELYIRRADAKTFARRFKERLGDQVIHQAVIDRRAGRISEIGSGRTHEEQYRAALQAEGVSFAATGTTSFAWSTASGSDHVRAGVEAVRGALALDEQDLPRFLFVREKLPNLCHEMDQYAYKRHPSGMITDEPLQVNSHLCDDLRYLAMMKLKWVKPRARKPVGYTAKALEAKKARRKAAAGDSIPLY